MRIIDGFVYVIELSYGNDQLFFGPPRANNLSQNSENLATNGLKVFVSASEAQEAATEIVRKRGKKRIRNTWIAELKLQIAESNEECFLSVFQKSKSLILVWYADDNEIRLMGTPSNKDEHSTLYASSLSRNGIKSFKDFNRAVDIARDTARQGASKVTVATFKIKRV